MLTAVAIARQFRVKKILIANRGEIAVRIIRACREIGHLATVAVYSDCDRTARHVRLADEACPIGAERRRATATCASTSCSTPRDASGADAVHPGYGFLAENAAFAAAVRDAGLTFIGPTPEAIALMGSKTARARRPRSRRRAGRAGHRGRRSAPTSPDAEIARIAGAIGYPLMVKAVAGGGGKGMRVGRRDAEDLLGAVRAARSEAGRRSATPRCTSSGASTRPRHIEVQLLGDQHGTVVPFVERECSIQRRHQKVVEERPSPAVTPALRAAMTAAAAARRARGRLHQRRHDRVPARRGRPLLLPRDEHAPAGRASDHRDGDRRRSGAVADSHRRAASGSTSTRQRAAAPRGHAIECRIYAEDPDDGLHAVAGPHPRTCARRPVRASATTAAWRAGGEVPIFYDPLLSKLVAWGRGPGAAIGAYGAGALDEYEVAGVRTYLPFFRWLLAEPTFSAAAFTHPTWTSLARAPGSRSPSRSVT